jgi:hypothetical protein
MIDSKVKFQRLNYSIVTSHCSVDIFFGGGLMSVSVIFKKGSLAAAQKNHTFVRLFKWLNSGIMHISANKINNS